MSLIVEISLVANKNHREFISILDPRYHLVQSLHLIETEKLRLFSQAKRPYFNSISFKWLLNWFLLIRVKEKWLSHAMTPFEKVFFESIFMTFPRFFSLSRHLHTFFSQPNQAAIKFSPLPTNIYPWVHRFLLFFFTS